MKTILQIKVLKKKMKKMVRMKMMMRRKNNKSKGNNNKVLHERQRNARFQRGQTQRRNTVELDVELDTPQPKYSTSSSVLTR